MEEKNLAIRQSVPATQDLRGSAGGRIKREKQRRSDWEMGQNLNERERREGGGRNKIHITSQRHTSIEVPV